MAGIYLHIPFCKRKCHYCNFFSVASTKQKDQFLDALHKEITNQKEYLNNEMVRTIYFGGGTPSMLSRDEIEHILDSLNKHYKISSDAEITLEANPDDLSIENLGDLSKTSINRLSIGIQSFFDDDLQYLNRVHNADEAMHSVVNAQDLGFSNISIDLIYGIPGLTKDKWEENLHQFFKLNVPHLSAYSLTVEPNTALDVLIRKKKMQPINDKESISHFKTLIKQTQLNDYVHYEISNFAKKGYYSKHNSLYWLGGNYLGLGPSAHSFNGKSRHWNVSSLTKYLQLINVSQKIFEKEILSDVQRFNEYVMTSIRTSWGCNIDFIKNNFGKPYCNHIIKASSKHIKSEHIKQQHHILYLTDQGKLFADGIAADLFMQE